MKQVDIAGDQSFLLGAAPAFELTFRGDGVGDLLESMGVDQGNGPPPRGIATEAAGIVLGNTIVQ